MGLADQRCASVPVGPPYVTRVAVSLWLREQTLGRSWDIEQGVLTEAQRHGGMLGGRVP